MKSRITENPEWPLETWFGAGHGGFDPKRTVTVTIVKKEDGSWDVSPAQDLKPGEYLLTSGMSPQGFDFGVTK